MASKAPLSGSQRIPLAAAVSDKGRVRSHNEDACAVLEDRGLFLVADGMGGERAGATASRIVVTILPKMLDEHMGKPTASPATVRRFLRDTLLRLSQDLHRQSAGEPGLAGMGATVALIYIRGDRAYVAHMGDSRAYLLRRSRLARLTKDHSVIGLLLERGEITPEEARTHPAAGRLTRYVGMADVVYPDVRSRALKAGDRLLLCTDGLTGMVDDRVIRQVLLGESEPGEACRMLVDTANAAGGTDNVSVLVVDWIASAKQPEAATLDSVPMGGSEA